MEKIEIEQSLIETMIDKPNGFYIDKEYFMFYPSSLGRTMIVSRLIEDLSINMKALQVNPYLEYLRVATSKAKECCLIIAYHTFFEKKDILNYPQVEKRATKILKSAKTEDIATILLTLLQDSNKYDIYIKHLSLDREQERYRKVSEVKESKNTYTFNGKSIYGTLISSACEKYHWTYDYVVWGIAYINLRLMLADSVQTLFLTDEERKKVKNVSQDGRSIDAGNPNNKDAILALWKKEGLGW